MNNKKTVKPSQTQEDYARTYLKECVRIVESLAQPEQMRQMMKVSDELCRIRERGGRLYLLGIGGSAAAATHAVNDFRKIAGFEAYAPTDNVSELTARANDEGFDTIFSEYLKGSRLNSKDGILVFSVGGGDAERKISVGLINAIKYAKEVGASVLGIVGQDGGYTAKAADACIIIPTVNAEKVTPHTEAFHMVISHLLVSSPEIQRSPMKWESTK
jgi:D-sedoheptulose 7-phosphate isomerase